MELALKPRTRKWIVDRVRSGQYAKPEDVIDAAVLILEHHEQRGDFAAGEMEELLAEGERSISQHGTLDGDRAFAMRKRRRAAATAKRQQQQQQQQGRRSA
jgi:hypothetical protein